MAELVPYGLPIRGAANATAYVKTPGDVVPPTRIRNVVLYSPDGDREQLGTRPGWRAAFAQSFGGPIQGFAAVSRKAVLDGYVIPPGDPLTGYDPCRIITAGTSIESAVMTGNVFGMDSVPSMTWCRWEDPSDDGGDPESSVNAIAVSPDDSYYAWSCNYTDSNGAHVCRITYAAADGTVVWSTKLAAAGERRDCNTLAISRLWVLVCANRYVFCLRRDTGAVAQVFDCNGWSTETIRVRVWTSPAGEEFAFIAFDGSNTAATLASGIEVSAGKWARHWRAGVMKCRLESANQNATTVLTQVAFGPTLLSTATYYEGNHGYLRISEQNPYWPRGCLIRDMAVFPDGGVVVCTTNTGWGPQSNISNPGYAAPNLQEVAKISVWAFDANGMRIWVQDRDSAFEVGDAGFYNDILNPTLQCVAVDDAGDVYIGGRRTSSGYCAFGLRGDDGSEKWSVVLQDVGGSLREGAAAVDPTDGHIYFGGDRNAAWQNADGRAAHLWKVNPQTGAVVAFFDLGAAVSALGVAVRSDGEFAYVGDHV